MTFIPVFEYLSQYKQIETEILSAIKDTLNSGNLILGKQVQTFERSFTEYLGGTGEAVAVNSGTDALAVSLMACGVRQGAEVITVSNTAVPTVSAIRMVGAMPVFCDVDENTALMDIDKLTSCITDKTRAVIPVHLYGNVVDVEKIKKVVEGYEIKVIEDCAQAHGAELRRKFAGTLGDAAAFSFYPTKNLGAYGDAGICYSADSFLIKEMRKIRMYGFDGEYYSEREGINSRMDEIQAAILNVKLTNLQKYIERRRNIAALYESNLEPGISRIVSSQESKHAYHLYVIKVENREKVRKELLQKGVCTGIHYPFPIHLMRGFSFLGYRKGSFPHTENLSQQVLSLPMFPELSDKKVMKVCSVINEVLS